MRQSGESLGLDSDALATLAAASVRSSFASEDRKRELLGEVEAWRAG